MSAPANLRRRLTTSVLGYAVLLSIAIAIHGYLVNEHAEQTVWESMLEHEFTHFEKRRAQDASYRWVDTATLQLYGALNDVNIPSQFDLSPGVHDEVGRGGRQFVLLVRGSGADKVIMALDITEMEHDERALIWTIVSSSAVLVILLAVATYVGVGRLVQPLVAIARDIASLHPDRRGQSIVAPPSSPQEAVVIAQALNEHLKRSDEFMDRELAFIRMTSHELRTPIAVIASTAEVGLDAKNSGSSEQHLKRILQTARDMKELLTLLLALARDPARLHGTSEAVTVNELLPSIIQDHLFLAERKQLTFKLQCAPAVVVYAPVQIVRATIGNLVRNAIENSNCGVIEISTTGGAQVIITDPGHGMSEEELSRLYSQLARSGVVGSGGGIGLDLIYRICKHFDWRIELTSQPERGTSVMLDFTDTAPVDQKS